MAVAVSQVVLVARFAFEEFFQSQEMRLGQIVDVDVVADARAVFGGVIVPKYVDRLSLPKSGLQDQWDEVGFGAMVLAQLTFRICTSGIEVAKGCGLESIGFVEVLKHLLHDEFGPSIGVDGILGVILGHGDLHRFPVGGARRGKDEVVQLLFDHGLEQCEGGGHVVLVILCRFCDRLADIAESREVHDRSDVVLGECLFEERRVGHGALDEGAPFDGFAVAVDEVIHDHGRVAVLGQVLAHVGADVAGTADD